MTRITRIEVIDENGRSYVNKKDNNDVIYQLQDDGRTLKVFVNKMKPKSPVEEAYKKVYGNYPNTGIGNGYSYVWWDVFQKGYNASKEEEYQPTPQTENEVAEGLKKAFKKAQQTEKWKETQKLIDAPKESWMDKPIEELVDKLMENPPDCLKFVMGQSLYDLIADWWDEIFVNGNPSGQNIESLIEQIELWLPKEQDSSGTQRIETEIAVEAHNELLQKIKSKLRNKKDT